MVNKEKIIKVYGREYSETEAKNKGIIDFNHQNFSKEEEEQIKKEIIPIPGQIMIIEGTQELSSGKIKRKW